MSAISQFIKKYDFPIHLVAMCRGFGFRVFRLWYTALARIKFAMMRCKVGRGLVVDGPIVVRAARAGQIVIGNHVRINSRIGSNLVGLTGPAVFEVIENGSIEIGDHAGMSSPVISSRTAVRIGSHAKLGGNVRIYDHDYHSLNWQDRRSPATDCKNAASRPICIGEDVFIGTNATIMKGVSVGDRSVIGAGSVVTKNIPADEIWAGSPARLVKAFEVEHGD